MGDKSETKGKNNERDDLMRAIFRLEVKKKLVAGRLPGVHKDEHI